MIIVHIFISFSRNPIPITKRCTFKIMLIIRKTYLCRQKRVLSTTAQQILRISWKMICNSHSKHHSWRYTDEDCAKPSMRHHFKQGRDSHWFMCTWIDHWYYFYEWICSKGTCEPFRKFFFSTSGSICSEYLPLPCGPGSSKLKIELHVCMWL